MDLTLRDKIASALHENWRKTRLNADGTFEPRWKKVKDLRFKEAYFMFSQKGYNMPSNLRIGENGLEIDIANSTYAELSQDWKAENEAAATVVLEIIEQANGKNVPILKVGDIIHNEWLKRNEWAKGGELDVPFKDLPKSEQLKDVEQYEIGKKVCAEYKSENEFKK